MGLIIRRNRHWRLVSIRLICRAARDQRLPRTTPVITHGPTPNTDPILKKNSVVLDRFHRVTLYKTEYYLTTRRAETRLRPIPIFQRSNVFGMAYTRWNRGSESMDLLEHIKIQAKLRRSQAFDTARSGGDHGCLPVFLVVVSLVETYVKKTAISSGCT